MSSRVLPEKCQVIFAWAVEQSHKGNRPSQKDMADYGSRRFGKLSRSTVASWMRRYGDPRPDPQPETQREQPASTSTAIAESLPSSTPHSPDRSLFMVEGMTVDQVRMVNLKLDGKTPTQISRVIGVAPSTIHMWMRDPVVKAYLTARLQDYHEATQTALKNMSCAAAQAQADALSRLVEILTGDPQVRLPRNLQDLIDEGRDITIEVSYADQIAAARTINQIAQAVQDRGGHPKTERQEVVTEEREARPHKHLKPEQLREKLTALKGGKS